MPRLHDDELDIGFDLVRRLVDDQFPQIVYYANPDPAFAAQCRARVMAALEDATE